MRGACVPPSHSSFAGAGLPTASWPHGSWAARTRHGDSWAWAQEGCGGGSRAIAGAGGGGQEHRGWMHLSEAALLEGKEAQVKGTSTWSQFYLPVLI